MAWYVVELSLEVCCAGNDLCNKAYIPHYTIDACPALPMSTCGNAGTVKWPETEIGQVAFVQCPCGVNDPLIQELGGTRRCGGMFDTGAMWEEPQCNSCLFSDTTLTLCQLAEVGDALRADIITAINQPPSPPPHQCYHFRLTTQPY